MEEQLENIKELRCLCTAEGLTWGFFIIIEAYLTSARANTLAKSLFAMQGGMLTRQTVDELGRAIRGRALESCLYVHENWSKKPRTNPLGFHNLSTRDNFPSIRVFVPKWRKKRWKND